MEQEKLPETKPTSSTELMPGDTLTVFVGQEKFSPVQFHSFAIGGHSATTTIQEGETAEEAFNRVRDFLSRKKREEFVVERKDYYERLFQSRPQPAEERRMQE